MVQKDDRNLTRGRSTRIHNFSLLGSLSLSQLYNSASTSKLHCPHKSPVPFRTRYGKFTVQQKKKSSYIPTELLQRFNEAFPRKSKTAQDAAGYVQISKVFPVYFFPKIRITVLWSREDKRSILCQCVFSEL